MQTQEADVIEISLEQTIEHALVKQNITDKVIGELKQKYGSLRLVSIDDKESYLEIKTGKREVAKWRTLAEKICKSGREDAIKIQKLWIGKEKEVVAKIMEIETPLQAEIDRFDAEVQRKEEEIKRRQEEAYMQRSQVLSKMGALYLDGSFVLNHISYEANLIKEVDTDTWESVILPKYDREYQKVEAVRLEQERVREEQQAQLKRQQEEFEEQQKAFREQQETFKRQQEEAERARTEYERVERERVQKEEYAARKAKLETFNTRLHKLKEHSFNGTHVVSNGKVVGTMEYILDMPEEDFKNLVVANNEAIEHYEKQQAEKRAIELEEQNRVAGEKAAQAERERISEEQRQAELKRQQEEQRRQEELAKSSDKEKFAHYLSQLNAIAFPEFKSGVYRGKLNIVKEKIEEINQL